MKWAVAQGYRDDNPGGRRHLHGAPERRGAPAAHAGVRVPGAHRRALGRGAQRPVGAGRPRRGGVDDSGRAHEGGSGAPGAALARALEVLDGAAELFDRQGLVFPSPSGHVLNHAALTNLLHASAPTPSHTASGPAFGTGRRSAPTGARDLRARACPRQLRPGRGCLPAQRPVRPTAGLDGRLGRVHRPTDPAATDCAPPVDNGRPRRRPDGLPVFELAAGTARAARRLLARSAARVVRRRRFHGRDRSRQRRMSRDRRPARGPRCGRAQSPGLAGGPGAWRASRRRRRPVSRLSRTARPGAASGFEAPQDHAELHRTVRVEQPSAGGGEAVVRKLDR